MRTTLKQQLKEGEPVLEKERVPSVQECKREGLTIVKQRAVASTVESNKSEVKTEICRPQIWSKQNVGIALKMRGITVKWKRSRARTHTRITAKEDIQVNRLKKTSSQATPSPQKGTDHNMKRERRVRRRSRTRRVMCRPPPEPPDRSVRGGGNREVLTTKRNRGSCMLVVRPPPKPPDGDTCKVAIAITEIGS